MSKIREKNTQPEMALRLAVWAAGLRYRLHPRLPGKPDFAFVRAKVAVFVDGCFWHGCPIHGHQPKSNEDYWGPKLARNQARDRRINEELSAQGWLPLRFWEHEIKNGLASCVERVREAVHMRS